MPKILKEEQLFDIHYWKKPEVSELFAFQNMRYLGNRNGFTQILSQWNKYVMLMNRKWAILKLGKFMQFMQ